MIFTRETPVFSAFVAWSQGFGWLAFDAPTLALLGTAIIQVIGVFCGLAPERRELKLDVT